MVKYALGVDIGGTKIALVVGDSRGKILVRKDLRTLKHGRAWESVYEIVEVGRAILKESRIARNKVVGVGIGIPGPVDSTKGVVPFSPHMKGWEGIPLTRKVSQALKLPVGICNDANAAALGEKMFGAGRRQRHFVYLTVSTGIGGGIIANGELIEGTSFMGGEVGHMKIVASGRKCACGKKGCLEAYASGTAIARLMKEALAQGRASRVKELSGPDGRFSAREVGLAAQMGDKLALECFQEAGFYLGIGISNLLHLVNPAVVVIGGGVMKSAPQIFWDTMMASGKKASWPAAFESVKIKRSQLEDTAGVLGAVAVAFERARKYP